MTQERKLMMFHPWKCTYLDEIKLLPLLPHKGTLCAMAVIASPAAIRVSHDLDFRNMETWRTTWWDVFTENHALKIEEQPSGTQLQKIKFKSIRTFCNKFWSSWGWVCWISPNCLAATDLITGVEPVSSNNSNLSNLWQYGEQGYKVELWKLLLYRQSL